MGEIVKANYGVDQKEGDSVNGLTVKHVDLFGDDIIAAQDSNGNIWAGASYFCRGLGMNKNEKDRQIKNIQADEVLNKGCAKFDAGVFDPNNSTIALRIEYVPLWLAKISITPAMKENAPGMVEKLVNYQLKAKDMLAQAFLPQYENEDDALLAKAVLVAQKKISEMNRTIEQKNARIEEMRPKEIFADSVSASSTTILIGELAKIIKQNGVEIGQNRLFKWLRENGYLINRKGTDCNMPTQKSMNLGLFRIKERSINNPDGSVRITKTVLVTGKGQQYFINKFLAEKLD